MEEKQTAEKIAIPEGITFKAEGNVLTAKGKHGEVTRKIDDPKVTVKVEGSIAHIIAEGKTKREDRKLGTWRAHIANMLKGCQNGHLYKLKICSGHFPMNVSATEKELTVKNFLGEKVPRKLHLKPGAKVRIEGEIITVESSSKELSGQVAADIEKLTRIVGRDSRIFQDGIWITEKDGKTVK
jgi:large subunit ribosomal protein L6